MDPTPDYTNWSNTDLIQRVTDLEAQLRTQNLAHSRTPSPTPLSKKKVKKPNRFDPSKYNTRLIALKFAYLGKRYNGFEHHSNNKTPLPTVEEKLWKALMKTRLIFPDFNGGNEDEVCWAGCEYSKCGRTDRGVSAFGQVIGLRVRSNRPKEKVKGPLEPADGEDVDAGGDSAMSDAKVEDTWDPISDELPYIQLLNRVLPPDIRILAWCPHPPAEFSARFNCKERRYRYFFTNPAFSPVPGETQKGNQGGAWLDIDAMQQAAKKLEGLHDFRNFCKVDPSKQISDFRRRIFHSSIQLVTPEQGAGAFLDRAPFTEGTSFPNGSSTASSLPELYYFEVHGSAFLWHQVRHMVAILFLVGQGHEQPSVVEDLLDIQKTPAKPVYEMADDTPLVLWDCIFPDAAAVARNDHSAIVNPNYVDTLDWVHVGDQADDATRLVRSSRGVEDRKYGRLSVMGDLWALWQTHKIDELLAGSLMDVVARQGKASASNKFFPDQTARVFDGSGEPRTVGRYVPIMQRERLDPPDTVNARYAARKGLQPKANRSGDAADFDQDPDE
ncbi:pseudouridine synthase deg1 [Saxophila tyrrhenica]|uniref:Pseudouridine synthase deg1 n=1 Tax=Saxophila tyrrhenica TaxID=1690608 RepID=A0AAV9PTX7_9PEZI|nr:pseudouridine synthase deg1 [Saxophila tyrrhenica]